MGTETTTSNALPAASEHEQRYAVTVAFDLHAGQRDDFITLVKENAATSIALECDCLRFDVLIAAGRGCPDVLLYEIYSDRTAFERHLGTKHFLSFDAATRGMVARKEILEFDVTEHAKPA
jgi:quinol monooxygenase YgiN